MNLFFHIPIRKNYHSSLRRMKVSCSKQTFVCKFFRTTVQQPDRYFAISHSNPQTDNRVIKFKINLFFKNFESHTVGTYE